MKNLLFTFLLFFSGTALFAQTYTSGGLTVTVTNTMSHDSTECATRNYIYFTVTVASSYMGQVVKLIDTFSGTPVGTFTNSTGVSPWSFTSGSWGWSAGGTWETQTDIAISSTGYIYAYQLVRKVIADLDTVIAVQEPDSLFITNPCEHSTISGHVFVDNNSNCIYDAGDTGLVSADMTSVTSFIPPGSGTSLTWFYPGADAAYSITVQKSWFANTRITVPGYYSFIFAPTACYVDTVFVTSLPATNVDFPLQCTSDVDVQCNALTGGAVRAFTPFLMHPYVTNMGCDAVSGYLRLILDPNVTYDASLSSHPADVVTGDTLTWYYSGLSNLSSSGYWNSFLAGIHLTPDATIVSGDTLCFRVTSNLYPTDIDPSNNDRTFCVPVVYSYDPNMKEVSPRGTGPEGFIPGSSDTLNYTLHFQNTGTAAAHNVKIVDTLDGDIDANSLRILGSTHKMSPKWLAANVVQFTFDNINLPDSNSNEPASHGAVSFKVALRSGLPTGTQIKNRGYIYFDLNAPVITNTALNTLSSPTGVREVAATTETKVYPNPATNEVFIEIADEGEMSIMDTKGSVVVRTHVAAGKTAIDISRLPAGLYILKTVNSAGAGATRFVKQ